MSSIDKKIKVSALIPEYHYRRGKLWGWVKGQPLTTLVANVFAARVEANEEEIERMIENRARDLGKTKEELITEILGSVIDEEEVSD
jgi:hypothetical protein